MLAHVRDKPDPLRDPSESLVLSWNQLGKIDYRVSPGACEWITFESIEQCIASGQLEDARIPQTEASHHAARIAWLVLHLSNGGTVDPIHIHINHRKAYIFDGSHRLRAHQFLGLEGHVASVITGRLEILEQYKQIATEREIVETHCS
jgi:hypothetical protein